MNHVMLDIETLGNKTNSVILSIGACYFNPETGDIGDTFNRHINVEDCVKSGLDMDASTVLWWMGQSKDAQSKITQGQKTSISLLHALTLLSDFIGGNCQVWATVPHLITLSLITLMKRKD